MAVATGEIRKIILAYIQELEEHHIPIREAVLFGSHAKGTATDVSDIDIALISAAFNGNRFEDRRRIVPIRRKIDNRIEPIPITPEDFDNGGMLVDEIKRTGITIFKKNS